MFVFAYIVSTECIPTQRNISFTHRSLPLNQRVTIKLFRIIKRCSIFQALQEDDTSFLAASIAWECVRSDCEVLALLDFQDAVTKQIAICIEGVAFYGSAGSINEPIVFRRLVSLWIYRNQTSC